MNWAKERAEKLGSVAVGAAQEERTSGAGPVVILHQGTSVGGEVLQNSDSPPKDPRTRPESLDPLAGNRESEFHNQRGPPFPDETSPREGQHGRGNMARRQQFREAALSAAKSEKTADAFLTSNSQDEPAKLAEAAAHPAVSSSTAVPGSAAEEMSHQLLKTPVVVVPVASMDVGPPVADMLAKDLADAPSSPSTEQSDAKKDAKPARKPTRSISSLVKTAFRLRPKSKDTTPITIGENQSSSSLTSANVEELNRAALAETHTKTLADQHQTIFLFGNQQRSTNVGGTVLGVEATNPGELRRNLEAVIRIGSLNKIIQTGLSLDDFRAKILYATSSCAVAVRDGRRMRRCSACRAFYV